MNSYCVHHEKMHFCEISGKAIHNQLSHHALHWRTRGTWSWTYALLSYCPSAYGLDQTSDQKTIHISDSKLFQNSDFILSNACHICKSQRVCSSFRFVVSDLVSESSIFIVFRLGKILTCKLNMQIGTIEVSLNLNQSYPNLILP